MNPDTDNAQMKYIFEKRGLGHTLAHTIPIKKAIVPISAIIVIYGSKNGKILTTKFIIMYVHVMSMVDKRMIGKRKNICKIRL